MKEIKATVTITPDGEMMIITNDGTFADGLKSIAELSEQLEKDGIKIDGSPKFERHRHDEGEVHQHHHWGVRTHG